MSRLHSHLSMAPSLTSQTPTIFYFNSVCLFSDHDSHESLDVTPSFPPIRGAQPHQPNSHNLLFQFHLSFLRSRFARKSRCHAFIPTCQWRPASPAKLPQSSISIPSVCSQITIRTKVSMSRLHSHPSEAPSLTSQTPTIFYFNSICLFSDHDSHESLDVTPSFPPVNGAQPHQPNSHNLLFQFHLSFLRSRFARKSRCHAFIPTCQWRPA